MKHLLAKTKTWTKFRKAHVEWRNTPRGAHGLSPSQWALGRRQRSDCPAMAATYNRIDDKDYNDALARRERITMKVKKDFDMGRRSLTRLPVGTLVVLQDRPVGAKTGRWSQKGTIVEIKKKRNTNLVEADGRKYLRNRRFLRPCLRQFEDKDNEVDSAQSGTQIQPHRRSKRIGNQDVYPNHPILLSNYSN